MMHSLSWLINVLLWCFLLVMLILIVGIIVEANWRNRPRCQNSMVPMLKQSDGFEWLRWAILVVALFTSRSSICPKIVQNKSYGRNDTRDSADAIPIVQPIRLGRVGNDYCNK